MSPSADDRPNEPANAEPASAALPNAPAEPTVRADQSSETQPSVAQTDTGSAGLAPTGDQPHRRRRRRRRHKGPRPPGTPGSNAATAVPNGENQAVPSADGQAAPAASSQSEAAPAVAGDISPSGQPSGDQPHKRRRRRRRRGPRPPGAPGQTAAATSGSEGAAPQSTDAANSQTVAPVSDTPQGEPRFRGRGRGRNFRSRDRQPREGGEPSRDRGPNQGPRGPGAPNKEFRDRDRQGKAPRDRNASGKGNRERGPRGHGKGKFGKGRDDFRRKPEPKLYSFESVVDRGFEDVTEEANEGANEGAPRRVEWTIIKRTVADQKAAKTVSAVYVLKREGVDTDFANLAAARAAVHKTIVHPEKLTRPKADYGSTKK